MPVKIDAVLPYFGTKTNVARFLGISVDTVYRWPEQNIPDKHKYHLISHFIYLGSPDHMELIIDLIDQKYAQKKVIKRGTKGHK